MNTVTQSCTDQKTIGGANATERKNPWEYPGWDKLVGEHPECSFFHGSVWARVLHETYGHRPFYFCRIGHERLEGLLPVMEVASRVTGRRGVSLPFTDSCEPLGAQGGGFADPVVPLLCEGAMALGRERDWRYLELRTNQAAPPGALPSLCFYEHVIALGGGAEALSKRLNSAVRRGIRKAEVAGVKVQFETGIEGVRTFYDLHCKTRMKHGLPPQPFRFFENIARHVMARELGFVAIGRHEERPIAGAVFFHFGSEAIYKFGASDHTVQHLRPNNLVMWESIKHCAASGFSRLRLGRTSRGNEGLRRFKLGFGASEASLKYFRYDFRKASFVSNVDCAETWVNNIFRLLPMPLLRLTGRVVYPHLS